MLERFLLLGSLPLLALALLVAGLGVPIPEDPVLLAGGVLVHRTAHPWWVVLPLLYGCAVGADCALYGLGRRFGRPLLERRPFRWLMTPRRRARVTELFRRYGAHAVFVGRHLPGLRALVFLLAGVEHMRFGRFVFWDGLAGLVTIPAVFGLGYLFSTHLAAVEAGVARVEHWAAAAIGLLLLLAWAVWSWRRGGSGGAEGAASRRG